MSNISFNGSSNQEFFQDVRKGVDEYFATTGKGKNANALMYFKSILYLGSMAGFYLLLITDTVSGWWAFLTALGLGFTQACIGFNVGCLLLHVGHHA
jgi:linoleoyl-CoA desaturase